MTTCIARPGSQPPPETVTVRETIHHGDFFRTREVTLSTGRGEEILAEMGKTSAYRFVFTRANRFQVQAAIDLERDRKCQFGWATFELVAVPDGLEPLSGAGRESKPAARITWTVTQTGGGKVTR
jgi:hypothetical protein